MFALMLRVNLAAMNAVAPAITAVTIAIIRSSFVDSSIYVTVT